MLTPSEQRDVSQALAVGDRMNDFVVSSDLKPPARIQFIAHLICALALAQANHIDYRVIQITLRKMHQEMNRTTRERKRPNLSLVTKGIRTPKKET